MPNRNSQDNDVYSLAIRGSGGFYTSGEISREAADYWVNKEKDDLLIHLVHPEDFGFGPSDDRYRLADYRKSANLVSEFGFTEIEKMIVHPENRDWDRKEQYLNPSSVAAVFHENRKFYSSQSSTLGTRTHETGHVVYRVSTPGKFDFRKLTFTEKLVAKNVMLIDRVYYNNERLFVWDYFENIGDFYAEINIR